MRTVLRVTFLIAVGVFLIINLVNAVWLKSTLPLPGSLIEVKGSYPGTFEVDEIHQQWRIITYDTTVFATFRPNPNCQQIAEAKRVFVLNCNGTDTFVPKLVELKGRSIFALVQVQGTSNVPEIVIELAHELAPTQGEGEYVMVVNANGQSCWPWKDRPGAFSIQLQVFCLNQDVISVAVIDIPAGHKIVDVAIQ